MVAAEILRPNPYQHGRVGVAPVARVPAHAVDVYAAGLAGGVDDLPAGAHAEGVYPASVRRGRVQLVFRGRKRRMPR